MIILQTLKSKDTIDDEGALLLLKNLNFKDIVMKHFRSFEDGFLSIFLWDDKNIYICME